MIFCGGRGGELARLSGSPGKPGNSVPWAFPAWPEVQGIKKHDHQIALWYQKGIYEIFPRHTPPRKAGEYGFSGKGIG